MWPKDQIIELLEEDPSNYSAIAKKVGVTREYIRQFANLAGFREKHFEARRIHRDAKITPRVPREYPTRRESPSEYQAYKNAKQRCTNPKNPQFSRYGGRGIEFRFESFAQFWKEIGKKPWPGLTLDRRDNAGHYEPGNIRWATQKTQCNNRSKRENTKRQIIQQLYRDRPGLTQAEIARQVGCSPVYVWSCIQEIRT